MDAKNARAPTSARLPLFSDTGCVYVKKTFVIAFLPARHTRPLCTQPVGGQGRAAQTLTILLTLGRSGRCPLDRPSPAVRSWRQRVSQEYPTVPGTHCSGQGAGSEGAFLTSAGISRLEFTTASHLHSWPCSLQGSAAGPPPPALPLLTLTRGQPILSSTIRAEYSYGPALSSTTSPIAPSCKSFPKMSCVLLVFTAPASTRRRGSMKVNAERATPKWLVCHRASRRMHVFSPHDFSGDSSVTAVDPP